MLTCRFLGPAEVTVDGNAAPPELLWRKHLALLAYLARSPKHARTREHLIGLLWGEKAESAARHSLREAVRILRQSLGPEAIDTTGEQVRIADGALSPDTDEFERCMRAERWADAVALLAGDFLEGFSVPDASAFEDWLAAERVSWHQRAVEALRRHADGCIQAGRLEDAVAAARRAVGLEPLSDLVVRTLMQAEALRGDRTAALDAYTTYAERVREHTGAEPAAACAELAERIRRARGPARPPALAAQTAPWSRRAPLAGRESALRAMSDAWRRVTAGGGAALAIIEGDLGFGKTRLLEELVRRVELTGGAVASALAVRADRDEAWSGLVGLARGGLAEAAGVAAAPAASLAAFAERIPAWADKFPAARGAAPAGIGIAFREIVMAAAGEQPVLLAADEAHWLDQDSLLALEALLRDLVHAPVLVVLTVASGFSHPALDELRAGAAAPVGTVLVPLDRLGAAEIGALAAWALPGYSPEALDRVTRRVILDSAGLPLLVVELLHAVVLGMELGDAARPWPAPARTLEETLPADLPDAVVAAVRVGYRGLTPPAQAVLAAMSVLPDRVAESLVGRAVTLATDDVRAALDELEWQRWIASDARGYAFVARIVKDIIAQDMLTPGQKRRILESAGITAP